MKVLFELIAHILAFVGVCAATVFLLGYAYTLLPLASDRSCANFEIVNRVKK